MTQDQRNSFVKLVEQVRSEFRSRRSSSYDEARALRAELEKKFETKFGVADLRKRVEQARQALNAVEKLRDDANAKVSGEVRKLERAESDKLDEQLRAFTQATAEVLAADDAKDAQKIIERLMAL
jgi:hypothetical protein